MAIRDSGNPALRSYVIDSSGYFSSQNVEDVLKEIYEALTTNAPSWALSVGSVDVNSGGITEAGPISGVTTLSMNNQLTNSLADGTAPLVITSTTVVSNLNVDQVDGKDSTDLVLVDGTQPLTADWDAGSFNIRAQTLQSDIVTGTAPLTIASTTVVPNLNADLWDGKEFADYLDQAVKTGSSPTFVGLTLSGAIATPTSITMAGHITRTTGQFNIVSGDNAVAIRAAAAKPIYFDAGALFQFRDVDNAYNVVATLDSASGNFQMDGNLTVDGGGTTKITGDLWVYNAAADEARCLFSNPSGSTYMGQTGAANEMVSGSVAGDFVISNRTSGGILLCADSSYAQKHLYIAETGVITTSNNVTVGGDLHANGDVYFNDDLRSIQTSMKFFVGSTDNVLILNGVALSPSADHDIDYGTSTLAIDVVYRASEVTTSFVGEFIDPIEDVKSITWVDGHLNHISLPTNVRILRIKEYEDSQKGFIDRHKQITKFDGKKIKGRFTGKKIKKGNRFESWEFISDEHYDVDGVAMLTLQALQKAIKHIDKLENRIVILENAA